MGSDLSDRTTGPFYLLYDSGLCRTSCENHPAIYLFRGMRNRKLQHIKSKRFLKIVTMKKLICWNLLVLITVFISCKEKRNREPEKVRYNPYVQAFTSGQISRFSPVYIIFSEDVPAGKQGKPGKKVRIAPEVRGDFSFENNRTLVFRPDAGFDRNTTYRVEADLADWFDTKGEDSRFSFSFTTLPAVMRAEMESLTIGERNDTAYQIACTVYTADKERPETVEKVLETSEPVDVKWTHAPDGRKHEVIFQSVVPGESSRVLKLSTAKNKYGFQPGDLLEIDIPQKGEFSIYDAVALVSPERSVEITFTHPLDAGQDIEGMVYLPDDRNASAEITDNKIRLYPSAETSGTLNVHINGGLRDRDGRQLGKDEIRQVTLETNLPAVRFVGNGVILPLTPELTVPFQAVNLRGVVVRVIRIPRQNIGQFLQQNTLDGSDGLMQVGRLVARKTIFLDEQGGYDAARWNTFALDLKDLLHPDPGAIYRLELSFTPQLSALPCPDREPVSREDLLADDLIRFKEESTRFDEGGYYYYTGETGWNNYNYRQRNDPCSDSYYVNKYAARNVLATNLGLLAKGGETGSTEVFVHNLLSTLPEEGVTVKLYNYQHEELGKGITGKDGRVRIGYERSKPFYLTATQEQQRSYLRIDDGSALSLSTFDVSGETVQKGIKGFIYGERGVWRPGDTIHLGFMLNDREKVLPSSHPVILELYNPLGQLYQKQTAAGNDMGTFVFDVPTEPDALTGAWNVKVTVGGAVFEKRVRIETIKPNRLKISLTFPSPVLLRDKPLDGSLQVQWLQGAVANDLKYEISGTFVSAATRFKGYEEYVFDDPAKHFNSEESKLITGRTDSKGNAFIKADLRVGHAAPGMLAGSLVTRVYEESGDFSIDALPVRYSPYTQYAGIISPQSPDGQLETGRAYRYPVVSVDYLGQPVRNNTLQVSVYKVNNYWWWGADRSQLAGFISDKYNKPVNTFSVTTGSDGKGSFEFTASKGDWGSYFIVVKDPASGHSTGIVNYFDESGAVWRRDEGMGDRATVLTLATDRKDYRPGDKMKVSFPSSKGSRAIVSIENGSKMLSVTETECRDENTTVEIPVTAGMQPNAYVYVTLIQPYGRVSNDLPVRLYGVVPFTVNSPESHLEPAIAVPSELKPGKRFTVTVSEKHGRPMGYTLAVVDEGLLDLTRFRTPDPWAAFNAREALGVRTWDLYNFVVGAYGGRLEQVFSIGGDDALLRGPKALINRFKPVVLFDGPFELKKGATQAHTYTMPNYNGRVRVMVVAGNGEAYGNAEKSVPVRNPVMILGTLPRVIGTGEEMVIPATVFATKPGLGEVEIDLRVSGNLTLTDGAIRHIRFDAEGDRLVYFRVRTGDKAGTARITLTAKAGPESSVYATDLTIRSVRTPQLTVIPFTIPAGKDYTDDVPLPGVPGTNSVALEVSAVQPLNLTARLDFLSGYPHGCLEQLVSRAFPLLYLREFTDLTGDEQQTAESTVKDVISRLRSYQTAEGAFSYWPGQTSTTGWGTVYAGHFMFEAGRHGYMIPQGLQSAWLANQRVVARNWKAPGDAYLLSSELLTQAYRLYVLSLFGVPEVGAMNRLRESSPAEPVTRYMLAAAYAVIGRKDVGNALIGETTALNDNGAADELTFGSRERDEAIELQTLCLLDRSNEAARVAGRVSAALASQQWMSTQTTAYALIAMARYVKQYGVSDGLKFSYTWGGKKQSVSSGKFLWGASLPVKDERQIRLRVENEGKAALFGRFIAEGIPAEGEEKPMFNGVALAVSYTDMNGRALQVESLSQGTNFIAVVTVRNPSATSLRQLVLAQIFPSGWEILNTRYMEGGSAVDTSGISYQDVRDDRVYSYIDYLPAGRQVTVRINLAAVYPGVFRLPPVTCQAMYDGLIRAQTAGGKVTVKE